MQQERPPPPAYHELRVHEPDTLDLPSVPTHSPSTAPSNDRLPGIQDLNLPATSPRTLPSHPEPSPKSTLDSPQWASQPWHARHVDERRPRSTNADAAGDIGSPMDTASIVSAQDESARPREMSVVSVDDPDVRLAAEALSGLGNPDFVRSPTTRSLTLSARDTGADPEPLLSLITSNHPWLGGTINGSISAYNATKGYSPGFVKYGTELVERHIGSPVVNTVASVGRRTGMEKNLRRYLGDLERRPSDVEQGDVDVARKRQRIHSPTSDAMEVDDMFSPSSRVASRSSYAESLPAYDDHRSPRYEETAVVLVDPVTGKKTDPASQDERVNWSTQLIMTTSGLGVALSDASLKSLRACLGLLRHATKHIDAVMRALKVVLEEYETAVRNRQQSNGEATHYSGEKLETCSAVTLSTSDTENDEQVRRIADRMKQYATDIWKTLQQVVQKVSEYTGGALPQNASQVVRTQLLSVPQRWQSASRTAAAEQQGEEARAANRMLAFAKEGLDMIGQITKVVDGTVKSAESWLARMSRKRTEEGSGSDGGVQTQEEKREMWVENDEKR